MAASYDRTRGDTGNIVVLELGNRNPAQTNINYVRGHDAFRGTY